MERYQAAIEELVTPGCVVLDVGAGTGILSLMAARCGARKVYAIESAGVAQLIGPLAQANGLGARVEVVQRDAGAVMELPEPVDVLITECMGTFGLSDGMFEVLAHSRRFLREGARVCPGEIRLYLAPALVSGLLGGLDWSDPVCGFDFSLAERSAKRDVYTVNLPSGLLRAEACELHCQVVTAPEVALDRTVRWSPAEPLVLDGFAGWFTASLSPRVTLDTGPGHVTHWGQVFFPIEPLEVPAGGTLEVRLTASSWQGSTHPLYRWSGCVRSGEGALLGSFDHAQAERFDPSLFI